MATRLRAVRARGDRAGAEGSRFPHRRSSRSSAAGGHRGTEAAGQLHAGLRDLYSRKRDIFLDALRKTGLQFTEPQGAYYVMVDISPLGFVRDMEAAEWFIREVGVAGVPGSSFFREPENR